MGWLPLPNATGVEVVSIEGAAPQNPATHGPQAIYSPASDRTYIGFLGLDRDLFVTYYDHRIGSFATPVQADSRLIDADDAHAIPTITIDNDGHIHLVWASHDSTHRHVKSDDPHDISAWTAQNISGSGTYPFIVNHPPSGDLYIFDRSGTAHSSTYPSHEHTRMRVSTDAGATWSTGVSVINAVGFAGDADVYLHAVEVANDGRIHLGWLLALGSGHDDDRQDVYHAIFDTADSHLYTVDGTDLGDEITSAEHPDCLAVAATKIHNLSMYLDGERVIISYGFRDAGSDQNARVVIWDGATWTDHDTGIPQDDNFAALTAIYAVKDGLRLLISTLDAGLENLDLYGSASDGAAWHQIATLASGSDGEGFLHYWRVHGGGPIAAVAQEAKTGDATTNATASDLIPLHYVIDPAHAAYSGAGAHTHDEAYSPVGHDHDASYYTEAEVDALLAAVVTGGEVLMQDGVTAPPVPIENEARDDWLYEG